MRELNKSNKIKVLFLIDTLEIGGAEQSLVNIAVNFKSITPIFVHIYRGSTLKIELVKNGIEVLSLDIEDGYHFKKALKLLLPIIRRIKPDIIHSTLFKSDIISRKLKNKYNLPLINSFVNNSYVKERYFNLNFIGKLKLLLIQNCDKFTSSKVDLFISNSWAIQNTNAKALNIPLNKIKVIHRGRDIKDYNSVDKDEILKLKNDLGLANRDIILNVSRLLPRKGQLNLLKAFKSISQNHPNQVLLIAGEGQYRDVLQEFITKNNLQSKIWLLGNRNDIPILLQLADLFVFPSWYEGLPGALIEAMMSKTPIVASNIPENLECLSSFEALIFEKGNVKDLSEKLIWAIENKDLMIDRALKARESSVQKFEISKISAYYEKVYVELLEN